MAYCQEGTHMVAVLCAVRPLACDGELLINKKKFSKIFWGMSS